MMKASVRAFTAGHRQGQATGDVKMLPGTFLVDRAGIVQYVYYSQHAGDHPDIKELVQAGQSLRMGLSGPTGE